MVAPTWWELTVGEEDPRAREALVLWFNSTLGLLTLLYRTEEARGPWIKLKKNKLADVPALDVRALDDRTLRRLSERWGELQDYELQPVAELERDPTRASIDAALGDVFRIDIDGLASLRHMLGDEPRTRPVPRAAPREGPETPADAPTLF